MTSTCNVFYNNFINKFKIFYECFIKSICVYNIICLWICLSSSCEVSVYFFLYIKLLSIVQHVSGFILHFFCRVMRLSGQRKILRSMSIQKGLMMIGYSEWQFLNLRHLILLDLVLLCGVSRTITLTDHSWEICNYDRNNWMFAKWFYHHVFLYIGIYQISEFYTWDCV